MTGRTPLQRSEGIEGLPHDGDSGRALFTAQIAGHHVVYSVILREAEHPFNREGVERHFDYECRANLD